MGQAKRRGSFKFRVGQAIARKEMEKDEEEKAIRKAKEDFLKLWDSWTDEEKEAFRQKRKEQKRKEQEAASIIATAFSLARGI